MMALLRYAAGGESRKAGFFFCDKGNFVSYIKIPAGGWALAQRGSVPQGTALGARMCQGTFFIFVMAYRKIGMSEYERGT